MLQETDCPQQRKFRRISLIHKSTLQQHHEKPGKPADESKNDMKEKNKNIAGIVRREDWKTEPMPQQSDTFILYRPFSDKEMSLLRRGHIPEAMEDKWFWYMEGTTLYAHRSWTGNCIYRVDFREDNNHVVTVNRDPKQYKFTSIKKETESLNKLLDFWCETPYDHYNEWLSETYDALKNAENE